MFSLPPLRRTYAAALRDLTSARADVRASAARDLVLSGDENPRAAADALAPLLGDSEAQVRAAAYETLGGLDAHHLIDTLARGFDDPDSDVRQRAVMAVGDLGGERALTLLRDAIAHAHPDVRYQCLLAIAQHAPAEGLSLALENLGSTDPWISTESVAMLSSRLTPSSAHDQHPLTDAERATVIAALSRKLDETPSDAASELRRLSAFALARAGEERGLAVLLDLFASDPTGARFDDDHSLFEAIDLLGGARGDSALKAVEWLRRNAARVLPTEMRSLSRAAMVRHGERAHVDEIRALLDSALPSRRSAGVRMAHIARLTELSDAIATLFEAQRVDAMTALKALGALGDERSKCALDKVARTNARSDLRTAAREALSRLDAQERTK